MNFEAAATETFQILRAHDYEVHLYDGQGNRVWEPAQARRLFARPQNLLVSIVDEGEDSAVQLHLSRTTKLASVMGLVQTLRTMATKYNLLFHVRAHGGSISPKEYVTKIAVSEATEDLEMNLYEGLYGTSRSSYLRLENARMIVRHAAKVDENVPGARGRNVESIFIENAAGERMLFPTTQLAPARALTAHIDMGGSWSDTVGQRIVEMAKDYAALGACSRHVRSLGEAAGEDAEAVRVECRQTISEMRRVFERLCRRTTYTETAEALASEATRLDEADAVAEAAELAAKINHPGKELGEDILKAVAKVLKKDTVKTDTLKEGLSKFPKEPTDFVNILGRRVNRPVWEQFKKGEIDLLGDPDLGSARSFTDRTAELSYKLSALAPVVVDDTLLNLFSYVADEMLHAKGDALKNLKMIAVHALRAADITLDGNGPSTKMESIREFVEWFESCSDRVLFESYPHWGPPRFEEPDGNDDAYENAKAEVYDSFDVMEFLKNDENIRFEDRNSFEGDELDITPSSLLDAIRSYLEYQMLTEFDIDNADMRHEATDLMPKVEQVLTANGYRIVTEESNTPETVVDEAMVLSREDVLLPKSQGLDLEKEVTKASSEDPVTGEAVEPDQAYVDRLRSLAGINKGSAYQGG